MFDAILAGCIPVILSHDFVWPFTKEFDRSILSETSDAVVGSSVVLDPSEYSIRLNVPDHKFPKFDQETCNRVAPESQMDLQSVLEAIPPGEIARLREGGAMAASAYSYYQRKPSLPDNPLKEGVLPEGGAAHIFIRALEERVEGKLWRACKEEVAQRDPSLDRVKRFVC
jgi:hypothetical protein